MKNDGTCGLTSGNILSQKPKQVGCGGRGKSLPVPKRPPKTLSLLQGRAFHPPRPPPYKFPHCGGGVDEFPPLLNDCAAFRGTYKGS
jgi:hypothetical protein